MPLTPPFDATPADVRALLAPIRHDFTIALHAADNAFAVGAVIRVAVVVGARHPRQQRLRVGRRVRGVRSLVSIPSPS